MYLKENIIFRLQKLLGEAPQLLQTDNGNELVLLLNDTNRFKFQNGKLIEAPNYPMFIKLLASAKLMADSGILAGLQALIDKAIGIYEKGAAQAKFCKETGLPMYLPENGICYACAKTVYADYPSTGNKPYIRTFVGYTLEQAANEHIDECPHCLKDFKTYTR